MDAPSPLPVYLELGAFERAPLELGPTLELESIADEPHGEPAAWGRDEEQEGAAGGMGEGMPEEDGDDMDMD